MSKKEKKQEEKNKKQNKDKIEEEKIEEPDLSEPDLEVSDLELQIKEPDLSEDEVKIEKTKEEKAHEKLDEFLKGSSKKEKDKLPTEIRDLEKGLEQEPIDKKDKKEKDYSDRGYKEKKLGRKKEGVYALSERESEDGIYTGTRGSKKKKKGERDSQYEGLVSGEENEDGLNSQYQERDINQGYQMAGEDVESTQYHTARQGQEPGFGQHYRTRH